MYNIYAFSAVFRAPVPTVVQQLLLPLTMISEHTNFWRMSAGTDRGSGYIPVVITRPVHFLVQPTQPEGTTNVAYSILRTAGISPVQCHHSWASQSLRTLPCCWTTVSVLGMYSAQLKDYSSLTQEYNSQGKRLCSNTVCRMRPKVNAPREQPVMYKAPEALQYHSALFMACV